MMDRAIQFILRHADSLFGVSVYLAVWILLPEVDVTRRAAGALLLSLAILVAIAGWDYEE